MGVKHKSGENPSRPGEYRERGPRGGTIPKPRQVTIEPGDKPMPPTLTVVGVGDVVLPDSRQVRGD